MISLLNAATTLKTVETDLKKTPISTCINLKKKAYILLYEMKQRCEENQEQKRCRQIDKMHAFIKR